jgi:hypothetical protein
LVIPVNRLFNGTPRRGVLCVGRHAHAVRTPAAVFSAGRLTMGRLTMGRLLATWLTLGATRLNRVTSRLTHPVSADGVALMLRKYCAAR